MSLPAIVFQIFVPLWSRAWRLNNVYAFAAIDILFALFWLAASIAVAIWNADGIAHGRTPIPTAGTKRDADHVYKDGTCASFGYGSAAKCNVSKATVGFSIIIFLLFLVTAYIAVRTIREHRATRVEPNTVGRNEQGMGAVDNEDKVWATSTEELQERRASDDSRIHDLDMEQPGDRAGLLGLSGSQRSASPAGSLNSHINADGFTHPGRPASYHSTIQTTVLDPPSYDAPSALSPPTYMTSPGGRPSHMQFPEANYNALR